MPEYNGILNMETGGAGANSVLTFLIRVIFFSTLVAIGSVGFAEPMRPNIILILADDLGWGDLSCYPQGEGWGAEAHTPTPQIDELAASGMLFTQAYATSMVCAPSRAGLLSGQHQQRFGYYCFEDSLAPIPPKIKLLPAALREAGYRTGMVGKWHFSSAEGSWPLDRGFEWFFGFIGGQHDYYQANVGEKMLGLGRVADGFIYDQDKPVPEIQYLTDEFTDRAINFMEESGDKPFFLYLAYNSPHTPLQVPWSFLEKYTGRHPDDGKGEYTVRDIAQAMIENLDYNIGRLSDWLTQEGLRDNTLIIFTSDNGGSDGGPARVLQHNGGLKGRKSTHYEGGIRVPFILNWPSGLAGQGVYTEPVSQLDLYPTLLSLAEGTGIKTQSLDGVDLMPFLKDEKPGRPHLRLFWGVNETIRAVRDHDWKLVSDDVEPTTLAARDRTGAPRRYLTQLYNLADDPNETVDLYEAEPKVAARLAKIMDDYWSELPARLATPEIIESWREMLGERAEKTPELNRARSPSGSPEHWGAVRRE